MRYLGYKTTTHTWARILTRLGRSWWLGSKALVLSGVALTLVLLTAEMLAGQTKGPTRRVQHNVMVARPHTGDAGEMGTDLSDTTAPEMLIVKTATTPSGDGAVVFNGETITYTITITNDTANDTLTDISILDVLPEDTLQDVQCTGCVKSTEAVTIPEPLGGVIVVTTTYQVEWRNIDPLAPGLSTSRSFSARVVGQPDGTLFKNQAFVRFNQTGNATSNEVATTVRVQVESSGQAVLSTAPTWFSDDAGGTLALDWGDFDGDGDLDLALGSSLGATIYENDAGRLTRLWKSPNDLDGSPRLAYGVRWVDFNNDNRLELVAVGNSLDDTAVTQGTNYVYSWSGQEFFETDTFTSSFQLVRVAPGDYDQDGYCDLVVSTNGINPPCPVRLYINSQDEEDLFQGPGECVSTGATASIGPGDFDNDGDLDLALGLFPDQVQLLVNKGDEISATHPFTDPLLIDASLSFLPYDFAWGDYNGDGYLDLAAAFPLERRIRIYPNQGGSGFGLYKEIRSDTFMTPLSIDWGDIDGDGQIELITAGSPPRVYHYHKTTARFELERSLSPGTVVGQVWSMPAVDYDDDGDLDLTLSNRDGPSLFFTTFAPFLGSTLTGIGAWEASSVAWGDADGDGYLDLLFGAGAGQVNSRLYYNDKKGNFSDRKLYTTSGFGPQSVAFGDLDNDGDLDLAFGTAETDKLFLAGDTLADWTSPSSLLSHSVAWGDADDDGDLDLLIGSKGPNALFLNQGRQLSASPVWTFTAGTDTRAVAWSDYNQDRYLDFAVGNYEGANQVYRNNGDNTFTPIWTSAFTLSKTTSMAWGDWDGDGDLDLAVGNENAANLIYENLGAGLSQAPVWTSEEVNQTTSLAWGDWDNDGDPDLAVGNSGQPDQVYANLSTPGSPQLVWLWTSTELYQTTGVAWGDRDNDGDLDLAISQGGGGQNGFYENTYVMPSHLNPDFARTMPLPNNPSYLSVRRPGSTDNAYFFSSPELLSGPNDPDVEIEYNLFDPDGTRDTSRPSIDREGDQILDTLYEFSTDGGGTWQTASPAGASSPVLTTTRLGQTATFWWDAVADQAIGDDARFRITIIQQNRTRPTQRAAISAVSPPFRVRALWCDWPEDPVISYTPSVPAVNSPVRFQGGIGAGSGVLTFTWDFDDGSMAHGQVVQHTFTRTGTFDVRLTVSGAPCPLPRKVSTVKTVKVGLGPGASQVHLPLVLKSASAVNSSVTLLSAPSPVRGLWGYTRPEAGFTYLEWHPVETEPTMAELAGYRIYRRARTGEDAFQLLATVPARVNTYTDETAFCGQSYYVVAFNRRGESPPSPTSYFSPLCQQQE